MEGLRLGSIRLLCAVAIAALGSLASGIAVPAYMDFPFGMTIANLCVEPHDVQTITVNVGAGAVVHLVVTYPDGSRVHNNVALVGASSRYVYSWTIEAGARSGQAAVWVTVLAPQQATAVAGYAFNIGLPGQPCSPPPPEGDMHGSWLIGVGAPTGVKKVCDPGLTGHAVFSVSVVLRPVPTQGGNYVDSFTLPASSDLSADCNGAPVMLPMVASGSTLTLHEALVPAGAKAAADTSVTLVDSGTTLAVTVLAIRNQLAQTSASPTPPSATPPRRLANTGDGSRSANPQTGLIGVGLAALGLALLVGDRRRRITPGS